MGCNTSQEQRVLSESNNSSSNNNLLADNEDDNINQQQLLLQSITTQMPFKFIDDEEIAAIKIQAAFRGHKVRNTVKLSTSSPTSDTIKNDDNNKIKTIFNQQNECEQNKKNSIKIQKEQSPLIIQSSQSQPPAAKNNDYNSIIDFNLHDNDDNDDDKELVNAATKIQATFRGHMQRKIMSNDTINHKISSITSTNIFDNGNVNNNNNNLNDDDIEEITKKVAEELNIDLNDPDLNKAATRIQASFRGYKKRRDIDVIT